MKEKTMITKAIALLLSGSIIFTGCVSTTMIQSVPTGAKLYLDGEPVGTTPYTHADTKIVGSMTSVKLEKEGYEPMNTFLSRNEEVDVGAIIGGIICWVPFLWVMKYRPAHTYEMTAITGTGQLKSTPQVQPDQARTKAERLRELKELLDENIITQEEYEKEKKKILEEDEIK
jgi:hypothetical protein